jgi:hypothetical protein
LDGWSLIGETGVPIKGTGEINLLETARHNITCGSLGDITLQI